MQHDNLTPNDKDRADDLAERVAQKLMAHIYIEIGRSVVKKLAWLALAVLIAVAVGLGIIKIG